MTNELETWELAGMTLRSRLLVGTARYPSRQVLLDALDASGAEVVTVAVRRAIPHGEVRPEHVEHEAVTLVEVGSAPTVEDEHLRVG